MKIGKKCFIALFALTLCLCTAAAFTSSVSAARAPLEYETSGGPATVTKIDGGLNISAAVPFSSDFKLVLNDDIAVASPVGFTLKSNIAVNEFVQDTRELSFGLMEVGEIEPGKFNFNQVGKWWQNGVGSNGFTVSMAVNKNSENKDVLKLCVYSRGTVINDADVDAPGLTARIMNGESFYCEITRNAAASRYDIAFYDAKGGTKYELGIDNNADFAAPFSSISKEGDFTCPPYFFLMADNYARNSGGAPHTPNYIADIEFSDFSNGRIKNISVSDVHNISRENPGKLDVTVIPYDSDEDISDIGYTYSSSSAAVKVDSDGNLTTEATGGRAVVTVTSSEGDTDSCIVTVEDNITPVLTVGDIDESFTVYETVTLPLPTVTENSDYYELTVSVTQPVSMPCKATPNGYVFMPTVSGDYTARYYAEDGAGNSTEVQVRFKVNKSPSEKYFSIIGSKYSEVSSVDFSLDGRSFGVKGKIGDPSVSIYQDEETMFAVDKLPVVITDEIPLEFDLTVNDYGRGYSGEGMDSDDWARRIGISLFQSCPDANGALDNDDFSIGADGFGFWFGRNSFQEAEDYNFRWELHGAKGTDGSLLGARHIRDVAAGIDYLPVYKAEFNEAKMKETSAKINRGESVHIKIERRSDLGGYLLRFGDFPLLVPFGSVTRKGTDFVSQTYLCIGAVSHGGEMNYDVRIDNIKNGSVKMLEFEENNVAKKLGNSYTLVPKAEFYEDGAEIGSLTWESSDSAVAAVNNGTVSIVGIGHVLITAKNGDGKIAYHYMDVEIDRISVPETEISLTVGEDYKINATSTPYGAPVSFASNNPHIAAPLRDGTIQAVGEGTAIVTVSYLDVSVDIVVNVSKENDGSGSASAGKKGCGSSVSASCAVSGLILLAAALFMIRVPSKRRT